MLRSALCWLLIGSFLKLAVGEAFLSLRFLTFHNWRGQGRNGNCCDGRFVFCFSACDHSFTVCLDRTNRPYGDISKCEYGKYISREITDQNIIEFRDKIGNIANPIVTRMDYWPGQITLKVDIVDVDDHNANDHVDYLQSSITLRPVNNRQSSSRFELTNRVRLVVEASVYCAQNYYSSDCSVYCKPRNDDTGHYTCHQTYGTKLCSSGWIGSSCNINEDNCVGNLCQNGGLCRDLINNYECDCPSGFKGQFCEHDINECLNQDACVHGYCINTPGSFSCMCDTGYAGNTCSIDINECLSSPCRNKAKCTDLIGDFTCSCPAGVTGKVCDEDVNECQLDQCKNNGTCVNNYGGFRCDCLSGYHGNDCSLDIDECSRVPCKNGGVCNNFNGGYDCQCADGYEGFNCDLDTNECANSNTSCYNNGVCVNTPGSYTCMCLSGYSGHLCQIDVNDCLSNPCSKKSTCHDIPGDYICKCEEGYTGKNCDQNINECLDGICRNNATCIDTDGSFECLCSSFWEGRTCQENINECLSNPCKHGGTCENVDEGFLCVCPTEFIGSLCEADMNECELDKTCENNATCVNDFGKFTCECLEGWRGQRCEEDINECERGYCNNLGTCINTRGGVSCMCPINWQGTRCDEDVNECAKEESPCRNNAICHNMISTFHCECAEGWTGPLCSEDVNECLEFPEICRTRGNSTDPENSTDSHILCLNSSPGFICSCTEGWTGLFCDEDIDECLEDQYLCSFGGNSTENASEINYLTEFHRLCLNTQPGYVCVCSEGWTGQNCDVDIGKLNYLTTSLEDTMNYESSIANDYEAQTSESAGHSTTIHVSETSTTVIEMDRAVNTEANRILESRNLNTSQTNNMHTENSRTLYVSDTRTTTLEMDTTLNMKENKVNEQSTLIGNQTCERCTDNNHILYVNGTGTTKIEVDTTRNVADGEVVEQSNLTTSQTRKTGNFNTTFLVSESGINVIERQTTMNVEENEVLWHNNVNSSETDISVPFYLACQITPSTEWTINKGLMKLFLDTHLFQGKDLTVTHKSEMATSKAGEVITKLYPNVTMDGKLLSNHEVSFVINKLSHKIKDYLHCSLFLGAVQEKLSHSASTMNSDTPDWYPALITVCSVLVVLGIIVTVIKCRRTVKAWYQNKFQEKTPTLSIVNPIYVSVGEEPEHGEDSDSKSFWPMEDSKSYTTIEDYISDRQANGAIGSAHSTETGNVDVTEQQTSSIYTVT